MSRTGKQAYKVTNWAKYNESLVRRGEITYWFSPEVVEKWGHANVASKPGRPFTYSDLAIECLLVLRELFRLPYRQTEGLARSLAQLMKAEICIPDFTSLAKRAAKLRKALEITARSGPVDVVVDSTGLKVYGQGEWHARQHGATKRRTWRKLHLAVNPQTQEIEAQVLGEQAGHDADQVESLLEQVEGPVRCFYGDGAYDQRKVYRALAERGVDVIIPPRRNAKIWQHGNTAADPLPRDESIRQIRREGRKAWKHSIGYHRRSLAETAMFRIKRCFGGRLKNRTLDNQRTEARLRATILNHFTRLGLPHFEWS